MVWTPNLYYLLKENSICSLSRHHAESFGNWMPGVRDVEVFWAWMDREGGGLSVGRFFWASYVYRPVLDGIFILGGELSAKQLLNEVLRFSWHFLISRILSVKPLGNS